MTDTNRPLTRPATATSAAPAPAPEDTGALAPTYAPGAVPVPPEAIFWQALANPAIPKLYANTFSVVMHPTDVALLFGQAGNITGMVSMNYSVAKTLASKLQRAVEAYENSMEVAVPPAESLDAKFREKTPRP